MRTRYHKPVSAGLFFILTLLLSLSIAGEQSHAAETDIVSQEDLFENLSSPKSGALTGAHNQPDSLVFYGVPRITVKTIRDSGEEFTILAYYPETPSSAANEYINTFIREEIQNFKNNTGKGTLDIRFETRMYNASIISLIFEINHNSGAGIKKALVFDLMGGLRLPIENLFTVGYNYAEAISDFEPSAALTPDELDNFAFDRENLYFYLNESGLQKILTIPVWKFGDGWAVGDYYISYYKTDPGPDGWSADRDYRNGAEEAYYPLDASDPPDDMFEIGQTAADDENKKYVALTFDDGPDRENTTKVLDALAKYNAKATFFILGHRVEASADLIARMAAEGHSIGNHSFNHKRLTSVSASQLEYQIAETNNLLIKVIGKPAALLRPPYGSSDVRVEDTAKSHDMSVIKWDIDPRDWTSTDSSVVAEHIISRAEDGSIILLHDTYASSAEAAILVLDALAKDGFIFVTVDELINMNAGLIPGYVYRNGRDG